MIPVSSPLALRPDETPRHKRDGQPVATRQTRQAAIQALLTSAVRHYEADRMADAERLCLQILAIDVRHADALYVLGMIAYKTERFQAAASMIRRAIAVNSRQPFYHSNLGNALRAMGKLDKAVTCFERALEIDPNHAESIYNLGNTLREQNKLDQAVNCYRRTLALKPGYAKAWCNLGAVYRQQQNFDQAIASYERALPLAPDNAGLCCNLAEALHAQGKLDRAAKLYKRTIALAPEHHIACNSLCNVCFDMGDLAGSIAWNQRALDLKPGFADALMNQSLLQLLEGDYASGWRNYEVRWQVYKPRIFAQPLWRGQPLNGARILLHAEQGLGDSLQFLRYVPMVIEAGGKVLLDLPANLHRIAALIPGIATLVSKDSPLPPFDFHAPLMSLPLAFGTTLATIPAQVPYLTAPQEALNKAAALSWPANGLRVGLAWSGNPNHPKNRARSIPLALLDPFFKLEGVHFFSLQMGSAAAELSTINVKITDLAPITGDMADTAAQMAHLDLIISIDTSIAHLAGALGKPVWVLLTRLPDWRWLLDREDSPWYPSARLFRQQKTGDWTPVIEDLRTALLDLAAQKQAKTI